MSRLLVIEDRTGSPCVLDLDTFKIYGVLGDQKVLSAYKGAVITTKVLSFADSEKTVIEGFWSEGLKVNESVVLTFEDVKANISDEEIWRGILT